MPELHLERQFVAQGYRLIAGLDEAGRGAWAGPVTAAAVILPLDRSDLTTVLSGVDDSKKLSPSRREKLFALIQTTAVAVGVGHASAEEIDRLGIVPATQKAMLRALEALTPSPQALLIDALSLQAFSELPQLSLDHGETASLSIAAASIVAKVSRDWLMGALEVQYPGYQLARHKGYGVPAHRAALQQLGISPIHRCSYLPVRRLMAEETSEND